LPSNNEALFGSPFAIRTSININIKEAARQVRRYFDPRQFASVREKAKGFK